MDVDGVSGGRMRDIKLNLDAQLSQVADPPVTVKVRHVCHSQLVPRPSHPSVRHLWY